jgi:excisionase family DNA binding protein
VSNTPYAMSPADAARWIGVSRSTLYRLMARGEIPVVKVGRRTLLVSEHLMAFVTGRSQSHTGPVQS